MLSPYRVLDLSDERGQFASMLLAQLGADVIVIEPPGGSRCRRLAPFDRTSEANDPMASLVWRTWNRGKRSIVLDYATSMADRQTLLHLVATADFLFESHAPGELDRIGLGHEVLQRQNPALIHVSITPFGLDGPKANWPATDLTVWAAAGPLALTGDADRAPLRVPGGQAFLHAAAESAGAALIALADRRRSGLGQHIDVSAQQAAAIAAQVQTLCVPNRDASTSRSGGGSARGRIRNRYLYPASDGHVTVTFSFGGQLAPFTRRLLGWMFEEGFCDERARDIDVVTHALRMATDDVAVAEYERLQGLLAIFTATMTKERLFREAMDRKLLIGPVATAVDVLSSPQLEAREFFDLVDGVRVPGAFAKVAAAPLRRLARAPLIDEHGRELRAELDSAPVHQRSTEQRSDTPSSALSGVRVLDLTWSMAGPMVGRVLADCGATVVHIESDSRPDLARNLRPLRDGNGPSAAFGSFNAGKLGLGLDLSRPGAREVALDLVRWADVVIESFSPRAMPAWGLGYEDLRAVNPRVVMLSSCLMGQDGPYSAYAAYGNTAASLAGFTHVTGWPDRDPSGPYSAYTDYVSPRFGVAAVLAALDHRDRSAEGVYIDLAQIEAGVHFLAPALLDTALHGEDSAAVGNTDPNQVPHGVYPCAGDDRWVAIACETEAQWQALAGLLARADLAACDKPERRGRLAEIDETIAAWTSGIDVEHAMLACIGAGVPAHVVQNSVECWADPQLQIRSHFRTVSTAPTGTLVIEGPRAAFSRSVTEVERAGPAIGEDSWRVLTDLLGYDDEHVTKLMVAGIVL